jgi:hypothetical protein
MIASPTSTAQRERSFPKSKGQEGLEYLAELLPKICRVFIDADNAEKLSAHQNNAQPRMRTVS